MWNINKDTNKWTLATDAISKDTFDLLKQELSKLRFYSNCLSGATYIPMNTTDDIYDILGHYQPRNWYISSPYSVTPIPPQHPYVISLTNSSDYYTRYLSEYGLTLKNLFTPNRLIKDSINNYIYVDVATTVALENLGQVVIGLTIDGVRLKEGHRVLVKDQQTNVVLSNMIDPSTYFQGNYYVVEDLGLTIEYRYYDETNGIYIYKANQLVRESDLDLYEDCVRFSISVKLGTSNREKQYHLSRLLSGYFPTTSTLTDPIEFVEKHNWMLRNRVDYNNLFEINYSDIIKNTVQTYSMDGITYSIPERTIAVGEFGIILNNQEGVSNIIPNKYKVTLRCISETSTDYWVCGDNGTILKLIKHNFELSKIDTGLFNSLNCISFFNDLRGVAVGDINTILITENGGKTWTRIKIDEFDGYNYNKVVYTSIDTFYIGGNTGVFLEFAFTAGEWVAYKRRVAKYIDSDDEYILVEDINDMFKTSISSWTMSYSYSTQSISTNKEVLMLVTNNGNVIAHDINEFLPEFDFLYLDFGQNYGDIKSITRRDATNEFYFSADSLYSFSINDFQFISSSESNIISGTSATFVSNVFINDMIDYNGSELLICGNTSLLKTATYSITGFNELDPTFDEKLRSKMLFLDYDIGSKLNFFDDSQNYRMPNSVTFSGSSFSTGTYLAFNELVYGPTAPSFLTVTESNWVTYWSDRQKTFEYYSGAMSDATKVEMSVTFSYYTTSTASTFLSFTSSVIATGLSDILPLAPNIGSKTLGRYVIPERFKISYKNPINILDCKIGDIIDFYGVISGSHSVDINNLPIGTYSITPSNDYYITSYVIVGGETSYQINSLAGSVDGKISGIRTSTISSPSATYSVFLYDYLMVVKTGLTNPSEVGDIMRFESEVVDGDFMINKVVTIGSDKYYYLFTEFNQAIIRQIKQTSSYINIINLNKYKDVDELSSRFNLHPISMAYGMSYSTASTVVSVYPKFNNYTSYYNLGTSVVSTGDIYTMSYTEGFLDFGYKPTYNILSYLERMNPNVFFGVKEYLAMPVYNGLPVGALTSSTVFVDNNYTTNKIYFGDGLKLEWESIFINTYVDVIMYGSSTTTKNKLLVIDKYYDETTASYVIEFHKAVWVVNPTFGGDGFDTILTMDIISRRTLAQISDDLQELNNIQRTKGVTRTLNSTNTNVGLSYTNYENELNFKFPTDSYAKILLSDADTIQELSALIYIDYKNELAMNITRLDIEYETPILNTINYAGNLYISCSQKHDLSTGDGVVLEFTGGTGSSQQLNQQYFGYHVVNVLNLYDFTLDIPFGITPSIGNDIGIVKNIKKDSFLNYTPVDIIDVGVDKKGKKSVILSPENVELVGSTYKLINVDYNNYRYRLVDGLNIEILNANYPWMLEAEIENAIIGMDSNQSLIWYSGNWECGRWFGGTWKSGTWKSGDWYDGTWESKSITDKLLSVEVDNVTTGNTFSTWYDGRWFAGTWSGGNWFNGRWYGGEWKTGTWYDGIWNDGTWKDGQFIGGIWVLGQWDNGTFNTNNKPAYWLDGKWYGGDFENGMWYNGVFDQKRGRKSRFGTNAYNSRTATWHGGQWVTGEFHSKLNINDNGVADVSDIHKFSIWYTGIWSSGNWYGGIAYDIDFRSGIWYGGILEDIQVIGVNTTDNSFTLNGIFKYNIGDDLHIIDNQIGNTYSQYGSNDNVGRYKILYTVEDSVNKWTKVYVATDLAGASASVPLNTGLRTVASFNGSNWKSGIWTNGLFENGLWEGGIWYAGVFNGIWS